MTSVIWTQDYDVNTMVVNPQKRLGLVGLLNILQDVAWVHGTHLGYGYEAMQARGTLWVLTRQELVMTDWPAWGERISLRTWVRPPRGVVVQRDYEIMAGERKLGECTASWLTLDAATRRPARLAASDLPVTAEGDRCLALTPDRIQPAGEMRAIGSFEVRNSDLDVNGHVNNTRYAQWILDAVPLGAHRACRIDGYAVNFLAETGVGDRVSIEQEAPTDPSAPPGTATPGIATSGTATPGIAQFRGRREGDGKAVFAARLRLSPRPPGAGGLPSAT